MNAPALVGDDAPFEPGPVLAWGGPRLRDLPWRRTRDPWAILVAEVMLQQTQVPRVVPKWTAFLEQFPDPAACAAGPLGDVLRAWHGLGYPRRGRNLHLAATAMVERHAGRVPDTLPALLALPGVGPYTARAVLAFAYERDVAVVDTNIARVLARTSATRLTAARAQRMADDLVPVGQGWLWNQVFMDLGATVCRPDPRCDECPLGPSPSGTGACRWAADHSRPADPAVGSAGVSGRQAPFEGSRRQARGRVLRALLDGPQSADRFDTVVVESLVADGLVVDRDGVLSLP